MAEIYFFLGIVFVGYLIIRDVRQRNKRVGWKMERPGPWPDPKEGWPKRKDDG